MRQRGKKHVKTGLHTDTGWWYPMQTPNLYLTLTFLNKKGNYYFYDIQLSSINCESEQENLFF